jgi:hypothetical protein
MPFAADRLDHGAGINPAAIDARIVQRKRRPTFEGGFADGVASESGGTGAK